MNAKYQVKHVGYIISLALILLSFGCGGTPKTSPQEIRNRLRKNSDQAMSSVTQRKRPIPTSQDAQKVIQEKGVSQGEEVTKELVNEVAPVAPTVKLPPDVTCDHQLACFSTKTYLVAEGLGATERDAELDAQSRLATQINSEVSSSVSLRTVEGDGVKANTQGEINQTIKSNFKRNELIGLLSAGEVEGGDEKSRFKVFAYLSRRRYQEELDRELERPFRSLESMINTLDTEKNAEVFVRSWRDFVQQRNFIENALVEYRVVVGELPQTYQTLKPQLIKLEDRARITRQKAHFIIEVSGAEVVERPIRSLIKGLVREYGSRVSSPGTCLQGDYLLRIETGLEEGVHQLTGGSVKKLQWGITLYQCEAEANQLREISQRSLPKLNGVERYNASAEKVLVKQLTTLSSDKVNRQGKQKIEVKHLQKVRVEVNETVKGLVELVVPIL